MISKKNHLVFETVTRLFRRNAVHPLKKVLAKVHPSDLADVIERFPEEDILSLFGHIPQKAKAADVLIELTPEVRDRVLAETPVEQLQPILEALSPDDLTDLIADQEAQVAAKLMTALGQDAQVEVAQLLCHQADSAGGIMTTEVFALTDDTTVEQAVASIREHEDTEMVFYLYVTDSDRHLLGVVSLRELLLAEAGRKLSDIMNPRVVKVHTTDDQEEVARLVGHYNILAIPVVGDDNVLSGVITMDDIIEVIQDETTEDMLKMAGTDEAELLTQSPIKIVRLRLPWLLAAFMGGLAATAVIHHFEELLTKVLALSAFLPIVMGMAGNVGTQSATVAVRGLATGQLDLERAGSFVLKEFWVGLLLGSIYGSVLGVVSWLIFSDTDLGWIVGLTVFGNMTGAAVIAIILPMFFDKLGSDPAIATGPFVTTAIDILGVANYFLIAGVFLNFSATAGG